MVYPIKSLGSIHKAFIDRSRVGLVIINNLFQRRPIKKIMHKSVEWCDLKPNWQSDVSKTDSSLDKSAVSNTLDSTDVSAMGL